MKRSAILYTLLLMLCSLPLIMAILAKKYETMYVCQQDPSFYLYKTHFDCSTRK